jgi:hypothetical protein
MEQIIREGGKQGMKIEIPKWKYPRVLVLYEDENEIHLALRSHGYNGSGVGIMFPQVFKKNENLLNNVDKWYNESEELTSNWWVPYNKVMNGYGILPCDILMLPKGVSKVRIQKIVEESVEPTDPFGYPGSDGTN